MAITHSQSYMAYWSLWGPPSGQALALSVDTLAESSLQNIFIGTSQAVVIAYHTLAK